MRRYVICQSYSEYRSRTTCTSGCMIMPMHFATTLARAVSPITAWWSLRQELQAFRLLR